MPGQALLTLSFFQVTRFIRQMQQQIVTSTSSEGEHPVNAMQVDEQNEEEEEEEDENRSLASSSVLKMTRTTVPKIPESVINTIILTASDRSEVMQWNEELMTLCETHFRQAINRRVLYDTRRKEMLKSKRQEAHRLFVEQQPSSLSEIIHQKQALLAETTGHNKPSNAVNENKPEVKKEEEVSTATTFDDLEDFFGGPITVVRATAGTMPTTEKLNDKGSAASVATAAVKTEPVKPVVTAATTTTSKEADTGAPPAKKPRFVIKR